MNFIIMGAILAAGFLIYSAMNERFKAMEKQLAVMRETIESLKIGEATEEPRVNAELRALLDQGKDVQAVKTAREHLGLSLLDAKNYVDSLKAGN
jgi:ribosomal protein L7/L12